MAAARSTCARASAPARPSRFTSPPRRWPSTSDRLVNHCVGSWPNAGLPLWNLYFTLTSATVAPSGTTDPLRDEPTFAFTRPKIACRARRPASQAHTRRAADLYHRRVLHRAGDHQVATGQTPARTHAPAGRGAKGETESLRSLAHYSRI